MDSPQLSIRIYGFQWGIKYMSHLSYMCCSSTLRPQVIFYEGHVRNFNDRELNILWSHYIQDIIPKAGESVDNNTYINFLNLNIKNIYSNAIINWTSNQETLKFTPTYSTYNWTAFLVARKNQNIFEGNLLAKKIF